MNYSINNDILKVEISDFGAELQSIKSIKTNTEYLWQADQRFWKGKAPILFPICGRLNNGKYYYNRNEYQMEMHGFARRMQFEVVEQTKNSIVMQITSNAQTLVQYPFDFVFRVEYTLTQNTLKQTFFVQNKDEKTMYFAIGGHPGFNCPIEKDCCFEDYYLLFNDTKPSLNMHFSQNGLFNGELKEYSMKDGDKILLNNQLFKIDGLFLQDGAKIVTLKTDKGKKSVTIDYTNWKRLGIWKPYNESPFICLEPWMSMPATEGEYDNLETKKEMERLAPNQIFKNYFTITINE